MNKTALTFLDHYRHLCYQEVSFALQQDILTGDINAELIQPHRLTAELWLKEPACLSGYYWFESSFNTLDPDIEIEWAYPEGSYLTPTSEKEALLVARITGQAQAILTAERTGLNFLQTLSATATRVYQWVNTPALQASDIKLLDTRKTLPGLRFGQKYAVLVGGGYNHRLGLWDAYLIKENHIAAAGSIAQAVSQARANQPNRFIEVETETLEEVESAIAAKVDRIMFDDFNYDQLLKGIALVKAANQANPHHLIETEVSGSLSQADLSRLTGIGLDYLSSGALTKHIQAIDFSLKMTENSA